MGSASPGVEGKPQTLADGPCAAFSTRVPPLRPIHGLGRHRKLFLVNLGPRPGQRDVCQHKIERIHAELSGKVF